MQHSSLSLTLAATLLAGMLLGGTALAQPEFAEGRILVKPAPGLSEKQFDRVLKNAHAQAKSKRKLRNLPVHVIEVPPNAEQAMVRKLSRQPHIAFAELDELHAPDVTVTDPDYGRQWHLPLMGAPSAWDTTENANGSGIIVAVLDTGVNPSHVDLSGQVLNGWNTVSNNTDSADIHNHGTWVAGVVAAKVNNGAGGASVAPGAKILPIRITNSSNGYAYFSDMSEGITWAADHGARVANLSYGGAAGSLSIANAASYMMGKGGVVMVAAGNDNTDYGYINHASLFVAAATTSSDARANYSSFGNFVDISAPGSGIYTTSRSGGYSSVSGTSFATPNTAAVAALIMGANPGLSPTDVLAVISNTAVDLGDAGWDRAYGHGRVDALAAVEMATTVETSDTTPPQVAIVSPNSNASVADLVDVTVEAADDFAVVERVDFFVNGEFIASDTTPSNSNQFLFTWDSGPAADGQHRLSAEAFDTAGNRGMAQDIFVQVESPDEVDDIAPTVQILSPGTNSSGSRSVTVSASANDNKAVTQISVRANGKLLCAATSTVSCTWNLRKVAPDTYPITAIAEDASGNQATASVSFTVEGSTSSGNSNKGGGKSRK